MRQHNADIIPSVCQHNAEFRPVTWLWTLTTYDSSKSRRQSWIVHPASLNIPSVADWEGTWELISFLIILFYFWLYYYYLIFRWAVISNAMRSVVGHFQRQEAWPVIAKVVLTGSNGWCNSHCISNGPTKSRKEHLQLRGSNLVLLKWVVLPYTCFTAWSLFD